MNKKFILFQIIAIVLLCVLIESVSFFILRGRHERVGFLIAQKTTAPKQVNEYKEIGLDEIDPLCGWAWSNKAIEERGFEAAGNCAVVRSKAALPVKPIVIFITGGSTTDMVLKSPNWINELQQIFTDKKINAVFYCGAVCGYNSWQELQKTMRDGLPLQPDIHISYSGANDCSINSGFVSKYENEFYETSMRPNAISPILPSTIFLLKSALHINYGGLSIKQNNSSSSFSFWEQNMRVMSGTATKNGYHFMGILQPVLGRGNYKQANAAEADSAGYVGRSKLFESYYPQAEEYVLAQDTTLFDFTHIFDTVHGNVFVDYCHIDGDYQKTVAENVYGQMVKAGFIPAR